MTVTNLKAKIDANVAKGASVNDVEAFLTTTGLGSSGLIDNAKHTSIGADPDTYEMHTIVRNTSRSFFVKTDIRAIFTFNRKKKLTDIKVEEVHTGL